jgi:hypothetical protein
MKYKITSRVRFCFCFSSLALAASSEALSQAFRINASTLVLKHELTGDPLTGGGIAIVFPNYLSRVSGHLGLDYFRGSARRTGIPCAGLIDPSVCKLEPLVDKSTVTMVSGGVAVSLLRVQRFSFALVGALHGGSINSDTRSLVSSRTLVASKTIWGGTGGVSASWRLRATLPVAVEGTVTAGHLKRVSNEGVVDGYSPFDYEGFRATRYSVGLVWQPRR